MTDTAPTLVGTASTSANSTSTVGNIAAQVGDVAVLMAAGDPSQDASSTTTVTGVGGWLFHGTSRLVSNNSATICRVWSKVLTAADIFGGLVVAVGPSSWSTGTGTSRLLMAVFRHADGFAADSTREFQVADAKGTSIANTTAFFTSNLNNPPRAAIVVFALASSVATNASATWTGTNAPSGAAAHVPALNSDQISVRMDYARIAAGEDVTNISVSSGAANTSHATRAVILQVRTVPAAANGRADSVADARAAARKVKRVGGRADAVAAATSQVKAIIVRRTNGRADAVADARAVARLIHRVGGTAHSVADARGAARLRGTQRVGGRADAVSDARAAAQRHALTRVQGRADTVADARARVRLIHRVGGRSDSVADARSRVRELLVPTFIGGRAHSVADAFARQASHTNLGDTIAWAWSGLRKIKRIGGRAHAVADARNTQHVPHLGSGRGDAVAAVTGPVLRIVKRIGGRTDTVVDALAAASYRHVTFVSGVADIVHDAQAHPLTTVKYIGGRADAVNSSTAAAQLLVRMPVALSPSTTSIDGYGTSSTVTADLRTSERTP